jgi:hypothetical protein
MWVLADHRQQYQAAHLLLVMTAVRVRLVQSPALVVAVAVQILERLVILVAVAVVEALVEALDLDQLGKATLVVTQMAEDMVVAVAQALQDNQQV